MSDKSQKTKRASTKKSKIEVIQEMYGGKVASGVTLEQSSEYLKKKGYSSLADLLVPSK